MPEVTVVGAGIAGLTAAITAAEHGARVRVLERRAELGGRARTTPPPYRANLGPHALYTDGELWRWLEHQNLLPPTVGRGREPILFRHGGQLTDHVPGYREALSAILRATAPTEASFRTWAESVVSPDGADLVSALAFITTYEADAGRLSAAFVHERIRRVVQPDVVRYVIGGWEALVSQLARAARDLGVKIDHRHAVATLPAAPVVVATSPAAAGRLLARPMRGTGGTRVALLDVALDDGAHLPSGLLDLDERLYLARYTAFDASLAPSGVELVQIACGCRSDERSADVHARVGAVLDSLALGWREHVRWSRRSLLRAATGAVDPPGRTWGDRPSIKQDDGVYCAGDYVAAPGLLSEVSFSSGREAGAAAAELAKKRRGW
jgi:phytoene dehydrogenase-like protein